MLHKIAISTVTAIFALFCLPVSELHAQDMLEASRWVKLYDDSAFVQSVLPDDGIQRSSILVLPDRFGLHEHVQAVLKVLAQLGYRAYAVALSSAPEQPVVAIPPVEIDSTDIDLVSQVAVDILNEAGSNGRIGLLGFDVGANVAIELVARLPFFKACALMYPTGGTSPLIRLLDAKAPIKLFLAQNDTECTLGDVNTIREIFMEQGGTLNVAFVKEAYKFFFNPEHEWYFPEAMKLAWKDLHSFFSSTL